jgi:hypothetical protein
MPTPLLKISGGRSHSFRQWKIVLGSNQENAAYPSDFALNA